MKHVDFVHLHLHTQYSLLDGAIRLDELFQRAKEYRMPALGADMDSGTVVEWRIQPGSSVTLRCASSSVTIILRRSFSYMNQRGSRPIGCASAAAVRMGVPNVNGKSRDPFRAAAVNTGM